MSGHCVTSSGHAFRVLDVAFRVPTSRNGCRDRDQQGEHHGTVRLVRPARERLRQPRHLAVPLQVQVLRSLEPHPRVRSSQVQAFCRMESHFPPNYMYSAVSHAFALLHPCPPDRFNLGSPPCCLSPPFLADLCSSLLLPASLHAFEIVYEAGPPPRKPLEKTASTLRKRGGIHTKDKPLLPACVSVPSACRLANLTVLGVLDQLQ